MNDTNTTNIVNIINTYPNYVQSLMIASICLSPCVFCGFCCLICCLTVRINDHIRSNNRSNSRIRIDKNNIELLNKTTKLLNIIELNDVKIIKECSICIDDYKIGNIIRQLKCSHTFHQVCIDTWLINNNLCPNCRVVVY